MSAICGWVGNGKPEWLAAMLAAVPYRGENAEAFGANGFAFARLAHLDEPAGVLTAADGAQTLHTGRVLARGQSGVQALQNCIISGDFSTLDGSFSALHWQPQTAALQLLRDPFGVHPLYYCILGQTLLFASELKQLLAIAEVPVALDHHALHKYLTFSFVPGEDVPIAGIRRLLPRHRLHWQNGQLRIEPYFVLHQTVAPLPMAQADASKHLFQLAMRAVRSRLPTDNAVGLYLSGGLDSAAVAAWLVRAGAKVQAFSLDFGVAGVERDQAIEVANALQIPLTWVPCEGADIASILPTLVHRLDLPFGDAVTGPQFLLGQAARNACLTTVFNGEGGDQLFGGWTQKPMLAAAVYGEVDDQSSPEEEYLRSYHRFYGLEAQLYTPQFQAQVGPPGQRRALLQKYLDDDAVPGFLNRVRLCDIALKGSQNILPRAERIASGFGLQMAVPLFDRALTEWSFKLPPELKMHGACEKYVLKLAMQKHLPDSIVWRRKFGMSVPVTDWLIGVAGGPPAPLAELVADVLGEASLKRRGLFRPEYVAQLLRGVDRAVETRRRRVGEKLWTLLMLELWLRAFVDRRGRA